MARKLTFDERENSAQNEIRRQINSFIENSKYYNQLRASKITFLRDRINIVLGFSTVVVTDAFIGDVFLETKGIIEELTGMAVSARLLGVNKERTKVENTQVPTMEAVSMWQAADTSNLLEPQEGFANYFEIIIRIL